MSVDFDDLARTLAASMPRRRALRLLGGAVAAAALPGFLARPAQARRGGLECTDGYTLCSNGKGSEVCVEPGGECCIYPEAVVACKAGTKCGGSINNACVDACPKRCKDGACCPKSKGRCVKDGCCPAIRTTFAPGTNRKGVACCPPGTVAVPGGVGECCKKGDPKCCTPPDPDPDDDLAPLAPKLKRGQLCVKGKVRKA
ncbi:MAG: hypothetical protein ACKVUT_17630 [Gaiella sp.]